MCVSPIYRLFQLAVGQDGVLHRQAVIFLSWWRCQDAPAQTWLEKWKREVCRLQSVNSTTGWSQQKS